MDKVLLGSGQAGCPLCRLLSCLLLSRSLLNDSCSSIIMLGVRLETLTSGS